MIGPKRQRLHGNVYLPQLRKEAESLMQRLIADRGEIVSRNGLDIVLLMDEEYSLKPSKHVGSQKY